MADADVVAGLGAKLDAMELTADEQVMLTDLLADADAEVVGYTASFTAMLSGMTLTSSPRPTNPNIVANMGESGSI